MSKTGANFGGTVGWDEQTVIGKDLFGRDLFVFFQ